MINRQSVWLWSFAAVAFIVGFILILNGRGAGWSLIALGAIYIGASTRAGQNIAAKNPLAKWGLIGITLVLVLLSLGSIVSILGDCC